MTDKELRKENQERLYSISEEAINHVALALIEDEWGKGSWFLVSDYARNKALCRARVALTAATQTP